SFPPRYRFLDPEVRIQQFTPPGDLWRQAEVVLVLDTGTWSQLAAIGPFVRALPAVKVVIDHHQTQDDIGKLRLVDTHAEATGGGRVAHTEIRRGDYEKTGALPQDSEDLVNYTRSLAGVEVGLLFMEQPRGGVKVSFRSRATVDVARIAEQFGGGGHQRASGATPHATLDDARARVLPADAGRRRLALLRQGALVDRPDRRQEAGRPQGRTVPRRQEQGAGQGGQRQGQGPAGRGPARGRLRPGAPDHGAGRPDQGPDGE